MRDETARSPKSDAGTGLARVPGRRRVTMTDVARAANCSQSTVSIVLNANTTVQISEATRERVLKAAQALGYEGAVLPALGAAVRRVPDGTVGFVIDNLSTSPEGVVAIDGVRQAVRKTGNIVLVAETGNDPELEPRTLRMLLDQRVEAIVYACIFTRKVALPELLRATEIPVFLLNCYTDDCRRPAVVPSEIAGGQRATQALIAAGHGRIATITGEIWMEAAADRLTGYRRALATADIPFDPALVVEGDWSASAGYQATRTLMARPRPPTAIFCQNDRTAIGCYEALKELGRKVPRDVSVVGYDDEEIARHLYPPLTTLILPHRAMGRWVIEQLFHGDAPAADRHPITKLECPLVERDSIGRTPAG